MVGILSFVADYGIMGILIRAILIVLIAIFLNLIFNFYIDKMTVRSIKKSSLERRRKNVTRLGFFRRIISILLITITFIFILLQVPGFRAFSVSLLAGAGILAIILGFAAQKTLSNIIAGISIAVYTPYRIGDRLKIGEDFGEVENLNLRHTVLRAWDNRRIIIPNSLMLEKELINYSIRDEKLLWTVDTRISYDSDIDKARKIMLAEARKHQRVFVPKRGGGLLAGGEPMVKMTKFGQIGVNLRLYFWIKRHEEAWFTGFELMEAIKKGFDKAGIEVPFVRDLM